MRETRRHDTAELRYADYTLDDDQIELRDTFRGAFTKLCGIDRVRAAHQGFDRELWESLVELGLVSMALPVAHGGEGASFVELTIVAEELGRCLAPAPVAETVASRRCLARLPELTAATGPLSDQAIVSMAPASGRCLVPAGAVAEFVLQPSADGRVCLLGGGPHSFVPNIAGSPFAWWGPGNDASPTAAADAVLLQARTELQLLNAARLVGVAAVAVDLGANYARQRKAFGVPIGSFQAIAHPLADAFIATEGARQLVHKAAWFLDNEPSEAGELVPMAALAAGAAASAATTTSLHVQGGMGFSLESDIHLYFRHAALLQALAGDRATLLDAIADARYGTTNGAD